MQGDMMAKTSGILLFLTLPHDERFRTGEPDAWKLASPVREEAIDSL
jgi:hypothetical protein